MAEDRFTIRWDAPMGCYRVSVPNLSPNGERIEVVRAEAHDAVVAERDELRKRLERAEGGLLAISSGHPNPTAVARGILDPSHA